MTLASAAFHISRNGSGLANLVRYIKTSIGYDAYLIDRIEASVLTPNVTVVTIFHKRAEDQMVTSICPKPNYILTEEAVSNAPYIRINFSHPIASDQPDGVLKIDGTDIPATDFLVDTLANNYTARFGISSYASLGHHSYTLDSSKLRKLDGTSFPFSFAGGYTIHGQSSAWLGDKSTFKADRLRGEVNAELIYLNKAQAIQSSIDSFLRSRKIPAEHLLGVSTLNRSTTQIELYILYVQDAEPQVIAGYPENHSLIPTDKKPSNITLMFSVELNTAQVLATPGLFYIRSGLSTFTEVSASHVTLLDDKRTVTINVTSYLGDSGVYTIVVMPGLLSLSGFSKIKPDDWVLVLDTYEGGGTGGTGTGNANMNDVMRRIAFRGMGA